MDEEDGRPGATALHTGRPDALMSVPTPPLQTHDCETWVPQVPVVGTCAFHPTALIQPKENHENVPGK